MTFLVYKIGVLIRLPNSSRSAFIIVGILVLNLVPILEVEIEFIEVWESAIVNFDRNRA